MKEQTKLTTVAILFGIAVSVFYLIGFWRTFNINVFQYADLTDVLKSAILPLSIALLSVFLTFIFMEGPRIVVPSDQPPTIGLRVGKILDWLIKWKELIFIIWFGSSAIIYQTTPEPIKYFVLAIASLPFAGLVSDAELFVSMIPHIKFRRILCFILTPFPFLALLTGSLDAHKIIENQAKYIINPTSLSSLKISGISGKLEYVGLIGNTFFLYDPVSKGLLLLKQSDNLAMNLLPNPAQK
ncbi:hypothetical protein [Paraburkholderia acidicola]|uniref:hypothetical protein n=1 Tax=Paraburkholderia acidicola TaxID=1912599 RepID=UPI001054161B|nr:hypothetical protein [Paraburkholderia acidicola]